MSVDLRKEEQDKYESFIAILVKRKAEILQRKNITDVVDMYNKEISAMFSSLLQPIANRLKRNIVIEISEAFCTIKLTNYIEDKRGRGPVAIDYETSLPSPLRLDTPKLLSLWCNKAYLRIRWISRYLPLNKVGLYEPKIYVTFNTKDRYFL